MFEPTFIAGALIFLLISGAGGVMLLLSTDGYLKFVDRVYNGSPNNRPSRRR